MIDSQGKEIQLPNTEQHLPELINDELKDEAQKCKTPVERARFLFKTFQHLVYQDLKIPPPFEDIKDESHNIHFSVEEIFRAYENLFGIAMSDGNKVIYEQLLLKQKLSTEISLESLSKVLERGIVMTGRDEGDPSPNSLQFVSTLPESI